MENHDILDQGFHRQRTPEEESEFYLLKMDAEEAMRRMRYARYALYFLALVMAVTGLIQDQSPGQEGALVGGLAFGAVYAACGFISIKNETIGFGLGLGIFVIFILWNASLDASSIIQGILLKIVVIYLLFRAVRSSIQMKDILQRADELGATKEELLS